MIRAVATAALAALPGMAQGFECRFETECYEAEPCTESAFNIEVDIEGEKIVTDYGDLTIIAVKKLPTVTTLFATGMGAEYMLSATLAQARLSTHNNAGPEVLTYLGRCEMEVEK